MRRTRVKNKTLAVFDCSALCYAAKYSKTWQLMSGNTATGVLFGFFKQLLAIGNALPKDFVPAFVWDSRESKRAGLYSDYKLHRKKERTPEDLIAYKQFNLLKDEILPELGFANIFEQEGYEADDIISRIAIDRRDDYEIILVTKDEDLYQLLAYASIMDPKTREIYTIDNFVGEYGISPSFWITVKAIAGCTTDNVKGVEGIGEKTAISYLLSKLKKDSPKYKQIEKSRDIIKRNLPLVKLPLSGTKSVTIDGESFPQLKMLVKMCMKYKFRSILDELEKWEKTFGFR